MSAQNTIRKMIELAQARSTELPEKKRLIEALEQALSARLRDQLGMDFEVHCPSCRILDRQSVIGALPPEGVHFVSALGERMISVETGALLQMVEAIITAGTNLTAKDRKPTRTDIALASGLIVSLLEAFLARAAADGVADAGIEAELSVVERKVLPLQHRITKGVFALFDLSIEAEALGTLWRLSLVLPGAELGARDTELGKPPMLATDTPSEAMTRMLNYPARLKCEMPGPVLTLGQFSNLEVGQSFDIPEIFLRKITVSAPAVNGEYAIARGRLGQSEGQRAVWIEEVYGVDEPKDEPASTPPQALIDRQNVA